MCICSYKNVMLSTTSDHVSIYSSHDNILVTAMFSSCRFSHMENMWNQDCSCWYAYLLRQFFFLTYQNINLGPVCVYHHFFPHQRKIKTILFPLLIQFTFYFTTNLCIFSYCLFSKQKKKTTFI